MNFGQEGAQFSADLNSAPRQERILELLARGFSQREIASHLGIAPQTVKNEISGRREWGYFPGLFERMGVGTTVEAVVKGIDTGILDLKTLTTKEEKVKCQNLSPTEEKVLTTLICLARQSGEKGFSEKAAAQILGISPQTLKQHLNRIYIKLGLEKNCGLKMARAAVIFLAYQQEEKSDNF